MMLADNEALGGSGYCMPCQTERTKAHDAAKQARRTLRDFGHSEDSMWNGVWGTWVSLGALVVACGGSFGGVCLATTAATGIAAWNAMNTGSVMADYQRRVKEDLADFEDATDRYGKCIEEQVGQICSP
ncbi:MAG TPA: hypothetical protein VFT22_32825 [Kofleriaceae bacterium]|nr:hypothetical protein [Kofleriaceae bacterium]